MTAHTIKQDDPARDMLYYDRWGQAHKPAADSVVRRRTGAFALCVSQNHVLMIKGADTPKNFELPGGGIEKDETLWQALRREVQEESGLDLACAESMPVLRQQVHFFAEDKTEYWVYNQAYYVLRGAEIDGLFRDDVWTTPESGTAQWVNLDKLRQAQPNAKKGEADDFHYIHFKVAEQLILEQE